MSLKYYITTFLLAFFIFSFSTSVHAEDNMVSWKTEITNTKNAKGTIEVRKKIPKKTYQKLKEKNQLNKATFQFQLQSVEGTTPPYDETKQVSFSDFIEDTGQEDDGTTEADPTNPTDPTDPTDATDSTDTTEEEEDDEDFYSMFVTFENVPFGEYTLKEITKNTPVNFGTEENPLNYYLTENEEFILDDIKKDADGNVTLSSDKKTVNIVLDRENNTAGISIIMKNLPNKGEIKLIKKSHEGRPLKGVEFTLIKKGETDPTKAIKKYTDNDGKINFEDVPMGQYILKETRTLDGYTLLKDPIEITLPFSVTETYANEEHIDLSKAIYSEKAQRYYFYELSYEIANTAIFKVPHTGMRFQWILLLAALSGFILIGYGFNKMKAKEVKTNEKQEK